MTTRHYTALDGLRGIAALAVLALHIGSLFNFPIACHAYLAVDFFFLLSGFVIGYAYDDKLRNGMKISKFLWIRLARLYPMIFAGLLMGSALLCGRAAIFHDIQFSSIIMAVVLNALLLPTRVLNYFRPSGFPANSPFWSLSLEVFVNIFFAIFFRAMQKRSLLIFISISAAMLIITAFKFNGLGVGVEYSKYLWAFSRVLFSFFLGIYISRHHFIKSYASAWSGMGFVALVIILLAPGNGSALYDLFTVFIAFPIILIFCAAAQPSRFDFIWKMLGALSYPLYTVHYPIVVFFANAANLRHLPFWVTPVLALLSALTAIFSAVIIYQLWDKPVRKWLKRFAQTASTPVAS